MTVAHFPVEAVPTATGNTKRKVAAFVTVVGKHGAKRVACTVPRGTRVHLVDGTWYVADLGWLDRCESDRLRALGAAPNMGRASLTYHAVRQWGIPVDEADVVVKR